MNYTLECELEDDGRWLAEVLELPGVLAYGATKEEAMVKAEALALRVIAERLEHGGKPSNSVFNRLSCHGMSQWPSKKARVVLAALLRLGWEIKRQTGSHRTLARQGWNDYTFAFHDAETIGLRMLARVAKHTGLTPENL